MNFRRIVFIALVVLLFAGLGFWLLLNALKSGRSSMPSSAPPASASSVAAPAPTPQIAFDSLGPGKSFLGGSGWSLGRLGHGEWFVAGASGALSAIAIAAEPNYVRKGRERPAGALDIFLSADSNGYPGVVLEDFYLDAIKPSAPGITNPWVLESVAGPALQAGAKYWVWARCPGPGSWVWRFNDQNRTQLSARETGPGVWASAGNGRNGAFTVFVAKESTNRNDR